MCVNQIAKRILNVQEKNVVLGNVKVLAAVTMTAMIKRDAYQVIVHLDVIQIKIVDPYLIIVLMEFVRTSVQVTTIALKDQNVLENHVLLLVVEIQV